MGFRPNDDWDADQALESLADESLVMEEDEAAMVRRLFKENSPAAAMSIIQIAMRSKNERIRLNASQYIIERVIGPTSQDNGQGASKSPLEDLLGDVVDQLEQHANGKPIGGNH